jgi:CRISPR system Cascade subunit CasE
LATLYIVSPDAPSLVGLDEQIGWPDLPPQWKTRDYGPLLNSIRNGQTYQFRLVANPVVSRRAIRAERGSSKRLPHLTTLQQASWLVGKEAYAEAGVDLPDFIAQADSTRAERSGFEVCRVDDDGSLQLVVSDSKVVKFPQGASRRTITLATVRYDGILRVTDADRLRHALTFGMGHGKGFGCGLLTLAQWRQ